jgi:hypothetical protein
MKKQLKYPVLIAITPSQELYPAGANYFSDGSYCSDVNYYGGISTNDNGTLKLNFRIEDKDNYTQDEYDRRREDAKWFYPHRTSIRIGIHFERTLRTIRIDGKIVKAKPSYFTVKNGITFYKRYAIYIFENLTVGKHTLSISFK